MISVRFQSKPFNITVSQVYAPTSNAEKAEVEWFYEDLQDLLELTCKKRCPFHHIGLECKSSKTRDSWSNRQVWPWNTNQSRGNGSRVLQKNALIIAKDLFQQHRRKLYTLTSPDGNSRIKLIIFFEAEDGEALYSQQKQHWELTVAKNMNSLFQNSDLNWRK